MIKLSLDALKQRAEAIASEDLLMTISGGTENACHDSADTSCAGCEEVLKGPGRLNSLGLWIWHKIAH